MTTNGGHTVGGRSPPIHNKTIQYDYKWGSYGRGRSPPYTTKPSNMTTNGVHTVGGEAPHTQQNHTI